MSNQEIIDVCKMRLAYNMSCRGCIYYKNNCKKFKEEYMVTRPSFYERKRKNDIKEE